MGRKLEFLSASLTFSFSARHAADLYPARPPVRPVRSINMHYPLHALFTASLPSLPPTRPLHTHPVTHSLTHSPAVVGAEAEEGPLPTEGTHFYSPPTPSWSSRPGLRR